MYFYFFCYLLNNDRTAHNDEIELPLYISFIPKKISNHVTLCTSEFEFMYISYSTQTPICTVEPPDLLCRPDQTKIKEITLRSSSCWERRPLLQQTECSCPAGIGSLAMAERAEVTGAHVLA
jgi:hypothetical protein